MRKIYFVPEVFLDLEGELHLLGWADIHPLLLLTEEKSLYLFCAMYGVLRSIFLLFSCTLYQRYSERGGVWGCINHLTLKIVVCLKVGVKNSQMGVNILGYSLQILFKPMPYICMYNIKVSCKKYLVNSCCCLTYD